ncbi:hypothetical protein Barb7_02037 [Bacteroidales bacterium Barb7]|nr:hypothetical protein Barb7_02037 [Bacteroidales bacterium Barb7]
MLPFGRNALGVEDAFIGDDRAGYFTDAGSLESGSPLGDKGITGRGEAVLVGGQVGRA